MDLILDYFDYYEPIPHIICGVAFFALICLKKPEGKKYNAKCKIVAVWNESGTHKIPFSIS